MDQELLSLKRFEEYKPVDHKQVEDCALPASDIGPTGKYMVLGNLTSLLVIGCLSIC